MAKWIGNILAITFGATYVRIAIDNSLSTSNIISGLYSLQNPAYLESRQFLFIGIAISITILFLLVVVSYLKPWGKSVKARE
ncbi:hypothetical protein V6C27_01910 [Peptococcaceae bacterium 1198_IL3148]